MKRLLSTDSAARKGFPLAEGLLDYFPDALAAVAEVSFHGNQKHNPGQPMHHSRGKSTDPPRLHPSSFGGTWRVRWAYSTLSCTGLEGSRTSPRRTGKGI